MRSEEAFQESVRSMRNQTLRADRAGDYWTDEIGRASCRERV